MKMRTEDDSRNREVDGNFEDSPQPGNPIEDHTDWNAVVGQIIDSVADDPASILDGSRQEQQGE
jgi:hypothetical protein